MVHFVAITVSCFLWVYIKMYSYCFSETVERLGVFGKTCYEFSSQSQHLAAWTGGLLFYMYCKTKGVLKTVLDI